MGVPKRHIQLENKKGMTPQQAPAELVTTSTTDQSVFFRYVALKASESARCEGAGWPCRRCLAAVGLPSAAEPSRDREQDKNAEWRLPPGHDRSKRHLRVIGQWQFDSGFTISADAPARSPSLRDAQSQWASQHRISSSVASETHRPPIQRLPFIETPGQYRERQELYHADRRGRRRSRSVHRRTERLQIGELSAPASRFSLFAWYVFPSHRSSPSHLSDEVISTE